MLDLLIPNQVAALVHALSLVGVVGTTSRLWNCPGWPRAAYHRCTPPLLSTGSLLQHWFLAQGAGVTMAHPAWMKQSTGNAAECGRCAYLGAAGGMGLGPNE